jgi:hypothetical protein
MTATTQPGITLDESLEYQQDRIARQDKKHNPIQSVHEQAILASLIRLREIEGKLRDVIKPLKIAIIHAETTDDDLNMEKYRDLLDDLSALLLRGKP